MTIENQNGTSRKSSSKRILWAVLVLMVVVLSIIIFRLFTFQDEDTRFIVDLNNPENMVSTFAYSLAYNKLDNVRSYISKEKVDFIEFWSEHHHIDISKCKIPHDLDLSPVMMRSYDETIEAFRISFFFHRDCANYFYSFHVSDVVVERIGNKWQISDWKEICESTTEEYCY